MKEFLEKIGLIDHFTTTIEVEKDTFISKFEAQVKEARIDVFLENPFDVFSSDKATYKGHVGFNGFRIKRRRKIFDIKSGFPIIAEGSFVQKGKMLIIETRINGIPLFFQLIYSLMILMFVFWILSTLLTKYIDLNTLLTLLYLLLMPIIIIAHYFAIRDAVRNLKKDLERDFFDWSKP